MDVRLTEEQARFVKRPLAEGHYVDANDVVASGLAALAWQGPFTAEQKQRLEELLAEGTASLEREEGIPAGEAFRILRERIARKRAVSV